MGRRIPASVTGAYNQAVNAQGDAAADAVRAELQRFFRENPGATVEEAREYAIQLLQGVGDLYGQAASQAAYDLLQNVAMVEEVPMPDLGSWYYEPDAEAIDRTAHYHAGKLEEGDVDGFIDQIADAAKEVAKRGANETMSQAARSQDASNRRNRRKGARTYGVYFARVPMGPTTCDFCMMLASRGFVYLSEESAGEFDRFHRHCDCKIIPGTPGTKVDGYDPDELYDRWKHPEKYENTTSNTGLGTGNARSAAPGVPKLIETVDFDVTPLKEVLAKYEDEIADLNVENAIIICPNGEVWRSVGDEISVNIESDDLDLTGAVVTHNHVKIDGVSSSSLSKEDFEQLQRRPEIAELRARYGEYNYSMQPTGKTVTASWDDAKNTLMVGELSDDLKHDVMVKLNADEVVIYSRDRVPSD